MKRIKLKAPLLLVIMGVIAACNQPQPKAIVQNTTETISLTEATLQGDELIKTNFGNIQLKESYLTETSIQNLNNQLNLQRAIEVYQWALPVTTFQMWYNAHSEIYGGAYMDFVEYSSFNEKVGILTANATTPYVISWADLSKTGPLVIDYPAGASAGGIIDFYQLALGDLGLMGADKGKGGKYLIIPNGYDTSKLNTKGYFVIHCTTNKIMIGTRFLSTDKAEIKTMKETFLIGKYGETLKPAKFISKTNKRFQGTPFRGLKYFELVHQFIQNEPQKEEDKIFYTYLKYLGIENGKPFNPSEQLKTILTEGANLGELMCRSNQMKPRKDQVYYKNSKWYRLLSNFPLTKTSNTNYFLDESNQYYYEAVTVTAGMKSNTPGPGTTSYLTTKEDKNGNVLLGSKTYAIHLPAGVPASNFWALTIYSENTRCFIDNKNATNKLRATSIDSRDNNLVINADGSVNLYIGPKAPEGKENNWLQTNVGEGWFPLIRTYGTQQALFDKTWKPGDFELLE
ncbi:DUF1214 domain-containing protein [uncultured Formosa sp.]|uniref:DUF1214 domain-containing protein n=1 Tax=uncultured Formosa sp. TaxID=255435 RepID=UPI00260502DE|nr:DUF1214 domain-containing protein [uncultured Formosa sp.]